MSRLNTALAKDILQTFVLTVLFFFGVQTFVGQPYQVVPTQEAQGYPVP